MRLQRIKETMKKIFFLPPLYSLMVAIPSFIAVVFVLVCDVQNVFIANLSFIMSSYALVITVIWIGKTFRKVRPRVLGSPFMKRVLAHPVYEKYIKEMYFRMKISLLQGFIVNLLYAGIKLFSGIYYRSSWLVVFSFYYVLLVGMRVSLLSAKGGEEADKNQALEWKKYRRCGIMPLSCRLEIC